MPDDETTDEIVEEPPPTDETPWEHPVFLCSEPGCLARANRRCESDEGEWLCNDHYNEHVFGPLDD